MRSQIGKGGISEGCESLYMIICLKKKNLQLGKNLTKQFPTEHQKEFMKKRDLQEPWI